MNMMNRVVQLSVAVAIGIAGVVPMAPASADVPRYQILTLEYDAVNYYLPGSGPYPQSFTLTFNPCDGTVSGPGMAPPFGVSKTEGLVYGGLLSYTSTYDVEPGYKVTVKDAMVSSDYSFQGQWSDNWSQGPQNGVVDAKISSVIPTVYR